MAEERVAWLSPGLAAALAGFLAYCVTLALEVAVLNAGVAQGHARAVMMAGLALMVAPWMEELSKRLCMWPLRASWGATGLAFGILEALGKLLNGLAPEWLNSALFSLLLHWGLGRVAERARFGLLWAILLHAAFNWFSIAGSGRFGTGFGALATVLAAVLLRLTFRVPRQRH